MVAERHMLQTELSELLEAIDDDANRVILVVGEPRTGKTTLLRAAYQELRRSTSTTPIFVNGMELTGIHALGAAVIREIGHERNAKGLPAIRPSSRKSFDESVRDIWSVSPELDRPVLLLDAVENLGTPARLDSPIGELVQRLPQWRFVIAVRDSGGFDRLLRRFEFAHIRLDDLELPELIWGERDRGPDGLRTSTRVRDRIETLPPDARRVFDRLAVLGSDDAGGLGRASGASPAELQPILERLEDLRLIRVEKSAGGKYTARLAHDFIRFVGVSCLIRRTPFTLAELTFGSEEGETDSLLGRAYVERPDVDKVVQGRATVVVGARGAGKSALVRRLAGGGEGLPAGVTAVALRDVGRALHSLVACP